MLFSIISIRLPTPTLVEVGIAYALLSLPWIAPRRRAIVAAVALGALALDGAWWIRERWLDPRLRVRFLDVGQGDAAVVELPGGEVVVVDGGGFGRSGFDVGWKVVMRAFPSQSASHTLSSKPVPCSGLCPLFQPNAHGSCFQR